MADRLAGVHPQMLRAPSEAERERSEADRKKLVDLRRVIGRLVERALELAGVSKQEAAHHMGYADQGVVSRWCSAVERPLFDKLFGIDGFELAWIVAMAERNPQMQVHTTVTIPRFARRP